MQDKKFLCAVFYTPLFLLFTSLKRFYQIGSQFLLNRNWICIWRVVTMGVFDPEVFFLILEHYWHFWLDSYHSIGQV